MRTREEALMYGLSFPDTYQEAPFHDPNWQLVRVKGSKKAFLWTYEKDGQICLNVKTRPEDAFFWRHLYTSVQPAPRRTLTPAVFVPSKYSSGFQPPPAAATSGQSVPKS